MHAAEIGFFQRIHGVTLCDTVRNCEILEALNVEPLVRDEPKKLSEIAVDREIFRVLLGLLPPRTFQEKKWE